KRTGVSPLWVPHWDTIEPGEYDPARHPEYGRGTDASLLASIMGHNLCLDIFGGPSAEEAAVGLPAHGEASTALFVTDTHGDRLTVRAVLLTSQLSVEREIVLAGTDVRIRESVENLAATDRPVGWTQHVTLGTPFVEKGSTEFWISSDRSIVFPGAFGPADYLEPGREFTWPRAPGIGAAVHDMRRYRDASASSAYTAHRMDRERSEAGFLAFSPRHRLLFGYRWRRTDFPWLGIWEENRSRTAPPWNGQTLTCGMEFGVSPFPETRRAMIERGTLFDTPTFRWLPARSRSDVHYSVMLRQADSMDAAVHSFFTAPHVGLS
ncbi:MAG TPA: hypothetical protein VFZ98_12925, partial [Vicinamibacterales bacterium]